MESWVMMGGGMALRCLRSNESSEPGRSLKQGRYWPMERASISLHQLPNYGADPEASCAASRRKPLEVPWRALDGKPRQPFRLDAGTYSSYLNRLPWRSRPDRSIRTREGTRALRAPSCHWSGQDPVA